MIAFNFNLDRALNAILYVASKLKVSDFHKIFKILYFADREHLSKYGRPVTGDTYIKMESGPVPSNIYDILKAVRGDSFFSSKADNFAKMFTVEANYIIKPIQKANMDYLSKSDIIELDASIDKCKDKSFEELKILSHDLAWNSAKNNSPISFEDILREVGDDGDYINYIAEFSERSLS
ncbi:MAG: SocA family protein [Bacteroidales bacterium]|jgi:hypothetical protein|nr:SocA family protein [Bacteroidales bacterium]